VFQFIIKLIVVKWQNGDAVTDVKGETQRAVINNQYFFEGAILNDTQIFDETIVVSDTVLAVKTMLEVLAVGVEEVQDSISVSLFS